MLYHSQKSALALLNTAICIRVKSDLSRFLDGSEAILKDVCSNEAYLPILHAELNHRRGRQGQGFRPWLSK